MENNFVHLNLHTEYSLSEGVNSIDNFLTRAKELGMNSLAVTDYANMFCAVEFYQKAKKMGIKPIIGLELPITNRDEQNIFSLTLLAKNYNGYKNLVKLASELYKKNENRELKLNKEILKEHSQDLIALSSSMNGEIGKAILTNSSKVIPASSSALSEIDLITIKGIFITSHTWATAAPSISTHSAEKISLSLFTFSDEATNSSLLIILPLCTLSLPNNFVATFSARVNRYGSALKFEVFILGISPSL